MAHCPRDTVVVIEQNTDIVERCTLGGVHIVHGTAQDEAVLLRCGITRASLFAIAIPVEPAALQAVRIARKLNTTIRIIARCSFTSAGMEAARSGADDVITAEQVIATEFVNILERVESLAKSTESSLIHGA